MPLDDGELMTNPWMSQQTIDGRNPAPVDIVNIPLSTGFYAFQVLQDFFHQQDDHSSTYSTEET